MVELVAGISAAGTELETRLEAHVGLKSSPHPQSLSLIEALG